MTAESPKGGKYFGNRCGITGRIGITGMAHDAEDAIFGQRTGGPGLLPLSGEPVVRPVVLDVGRVNEGDQDIDVE